MASLSEDYNGRLRVDFIDHKNKVVYEINGGNYKRTKKGAQGHSSPKGLARDYVKQSISQMLGYTHHELDTKMADDQQYVGILVRASMGLPPDNDDFEYMAQFYR